MRSAGAELDPGLRRHGGGGLALSHREPLGLYHCGWTIRPPTMRTVLPHLALQGCPGPHGAQEAGGGPLCVEIPEEEMGAYTSSAPPLWRRSDRRTPPFRLTPFPEPPMPLANHATSVPVTVDDDKCIAEKGCRVFASDVCRWMCWPSTPLRQGAHESYDECWYCMPCEGIAPPAR